MTSKTRFFNFPPVTARQWKQQIQAGLKGKDYNDLLVWDSPDKIKVKPFYSAEDLEDLDVMQVSSPQEWKIGQTIALLDAKSANAKARATLEKGAESLHFITHREPDLNILLEGIDLTSVPIHLEVPTFSSALKEGLKSLPSDVKASVFLYRDVIGHLARTGNWYRSMEEDLNSAFEAVSSLPDMHTISVDGTLYQNAGANRIQQLAYTLAHACEYLQFGHSHAKKVSSAAPVFRMAVDSNYFFEIAKLRAMRLLWASLAKEFGAPEICHITAQPTRRNKTVYEYNANMLRTTMECMAAVNGGADTVLNLPYDALYHEENEFGERMGRNQLLILKNESYFGAVTNPADGAYYIESLTQRLAEKALVLFRQLESSGGFLASLKKHSIQKKIREQAAEEQKQFDNGAKVLVGTNAYDNPDDRMKAELEISPFSGKRSEKTLVEPILEKRLAEGLEKKRLEHE